MRAKEFTINIPINITMNQDGEIDVDVDGKDQSNEEPDQKVWTSPLQQEVELEKEKSGKDSHIIDQITQPEEYSETEKDDYIGDPNAEKE